MAVPVAVGLLTSATAAAEGNFTRLLARDDGQAFADDYLPRLAPAMGLVYAGPVPVRRADAAALQAVLLRAMARQYPDDTLAHMGRAYAAIGLLPPGTDLRAEALRLYQAQVVGFYDPIERRMSLMQGADAQAQTNVLRHELAHALQDQSYPLQARIDRAAQDDDQALAFQAVLEGQAMVAMNLDLAVHAPKSAKEPVKGASTANPDRQQAAVRDMFAGTDVSLSADEVAVLSHVQSREVVEALQAQLSGAGKLGEGALQTTQQALGATKQGASKVLGAATDTFAGALADLEGALGVGGKGEASHATLTREPDTIPYLQAQLTFPYVEGRAFIETLAQGRSLSTVINETLAKPPLSTREVLHPELYGEPETPIAPLPIETQKGTRVVWKTTVGELNVRTLLAPCTQDAGLEAQLRADRLVLLAVGEAQSVAWRTRWRTGAAAAAFARCMQKVAPNLVVHARGSEVGLRQCVTRECSAGKTAIDIFP